MNDSTPNTGVVIGAGIIGLCCALRLQQQGLRTTLVDPDPQTAGASYGNAGHIATEQVEPLASWASLRSAPRRLFVLGGALDVRDPATTLPWMGRCVQASSAARFRAGCDALRGVLAQALPAWGRLGNDLAAPELIQRGGHIVLWESQRSAQRRLAAWRATDIGSASLRPLTASELDAFAPLLRKRPVGGIRFDGTGQVADVVQVLRALRAAFTQAGGAFVQARVRALDAQGGKVSAVLDDGCQLHGDRVLVAAGVASRALMGSLGLHAPLIAERGYHLQWARHGWPAGMPPVVFEDRSVIVTRFREGLRAASFVEFARADAPADARKWQRLRAHVGDLGIALEGEGARWFGARPTLPDYLPAIGRSTALPNLMYAFGHQHLGLTLAPITAEIVVALSAGHTIPVPTAGFDLQRFQPHARSTQ